MPSRPRNAALLWLVLAALLGFFVSAPYFHRNLIGLDASGFPFGATLQSIAEMLFPQVQNAVGGIVLAFGALLLVATGAFVGVRASVRGERARTDPGRRGFLTGAASGLGAALGAALVGGGAMVTRAIFGVGQPGLGWSKVGQGIRVDAPQTHPEWLEAWKGSRIRQHRRLGRTDAEVSDICLGSTRISGEKGERIVRAALERGVTYIDTAPDYSETGSEQAIGRAIRGLRDRLFLATKFCTPIGHLPAGAPVSAYKEVVEASLGRLGTDHVDLVHIHACDSVERLMDPNAHEAFERLKQEGKARFLGFSSHTPNLVQVADTAIDSGLFDVMMLAYHHGVWAPLAGIMERARRERDMGIVAMKTLKGAKHHGLAGFRRERDAYSQAAFKWVLSNPHVSCLVISFFEPQHVDEYLYASGKAPAPDDLAVLDKYDREILGTYCSPHCGECLDRCPEALSIPEVLRYRMYFEDYGWEKEGMRLYGRIAKQASVCASCRAPCLGACPVGIPIQARMREAHEMLTLC
jgi:predicted aldo/keto reductase-like oxidoreductase